MQFDIFYRLKIEITRMMNRYKHIHILVLTLLLTPFFTIGQTKYSNEFLNLGVGAKGLALANTQTAMSNDATSGYWNPAGLAFVEKNYQLSLMHAEYFASIAKYDYLAISARIDEHQAVGMSVLRFGVDGIPNTTQLIDNQGNINYDRISYFTAADWGILLSYGRTFQQVEGLAFGANVKIIRRRIGDFAGAWGFGLDAGLQYRIKKWSLGLVVKDLTSTFNAWNFNLSDSMQATFIKTGNSLPENGLEYTLPSANFGFGRDFELGKGFNFMAALDLDMTFDGKRNTLISSKVINIDPHLGIQFGYKNIVFLRGGVGNFQKETNFDNKQKYTCQINLGIGIGIKNIVFIDYAFCDVGDVSIALYSHIFSLRLAIDHFKQQASDNN